MSNSQLLVISGPIASGKSTVAHKVATDFRGAGHSVAEVDLDLLYTMLEDRVPMDDPRTWRKARRAAAALTDAFVLDGVEFIIVEGTFWTQSERDEFANHLTTAVRPVYVSIVVSFDEALRRVQDDPNRRVLRIPEFLRASHADFAAAPQIPGDLLIDSTNCRVDEAVSLITDVLGTDNLSDRGVRPLFRNVDCVQIPVPDLESGLAFYRDALGQAVIWRTTKAAGLSLSDSAAELVIQTERPELEPNLSVASADLAARQFVEAGGTVLVGPFAIAIGRCVVVQDPWGNRLVMLDHSRGRLLTHTPAGSSPAAVAHPER